MPHNFHKLLSDVFDLAHESEFFIDKYLSTKFYKFQYLSRIYGKLHEVDKRFI